jgi:hypothetical protein
MDPARAGVVLARYAGIEEKAGQLAADEDGGPRQLVVSSDFYSVYTSAGKRQTAWSTSATPIRRTRSR